MVVVVTVATITATVSEGVVVVAVSRLSCNFCCLLLFVLLSLAYCCLMLIVVGRLLLFIVVVVLCCCCSCSCSCWSPAAACSQADFVLEEIPDSVHCNFFQQ